MNHSNFNILTIENLSIGYTSKKGNAVIASDIDLTLPKGQLVGLIGINGAGKSTLLRTLSGLQNPLSGKCILEQTPIHNITPEYLARHLSVVLTGQAISKNLSVLELVSLGRQPYTNWLGTLTEADIQVITETLEATDTNHLKDKKCYELSDGQLQRVLIARALAQDTSIMILDEPMTHLDLHHKAAVLKLLTEIAHKQQKLVLFSTHDIELAITHCDQLIVLQDKKAMMNTPKQLIHEGVFDTLFPSKNVKFDSSSGRFLIS
ncbi:ABC transporter ATP-binding protein [uncultured Dokdonia sp.]|uniref:ABC transporter ATP-binding protein n=1 Tax=uncultured Dokdonia sp. TaxID=575653 RepID=UPI0026017690|nr:ABC transporter ATP-binding protein [uncultured Dokdonia sp.]